MNSQIKEKWIDALLSGEYEQTQGNLYEPGVGYCCLGVLTDLYLKEKGLEWDTNCTFLSGWGSVDDEYEFLPDCVRDWAGLKDNRGTYDDDTEEALALTDLNDNGNTFDYIAEVIDSNF